MIDATLTDIRIYPVKGEPGRRLESIAIGPDGLDGDRRKKAAVHVVSQDDTSDARANLFVSATEDELVAAVGDHLRVGGVVLAVTRVPSGCPGVYASVMSSGLVRVGDGVCGVGA